MKCPRCKVWSLRSPKNLRSDGIFLIIGGTFIAGTIGMVMIVSTVLLLRTPTSTINASGVYKSGTIGLILLAGFLLGIMFIGEGIYRAATKTASKFAFKFGYRMLMSIAILSVFFRILIGFYFH